MKAKFTLGLCSIVVILLISSIISILEYRSMSNYVSDLISENIRSINVARQLSNAANDYNLKLLAVIGGADGGGADGAIPGASGVAADSASPSLPAFDLAASVRECERLRDTLDSHELGPLADSVLCSYSAYMLAAREFSERRHTAFAQGRTRYFQTLQPALRRLTDDIERLNDFTYSRLMKHSATFERGFYRSIIPGVVAVMVGIGLVLLLLFFLVVYYANPIGRMLSGLENYRSYNRKYSCRVDGDDELSELNDGIAELANENRQLRKRIRDLRRKNDGD